MSKSKKKRNKKYTGPDAKTNDGLVRVHKVNAVVRSPFQQWVHEHKKLVKRVAIAAAVVAVVVFLIVQAFIAMNG
jgi:negative regulator of sigma E activity